MQKINARLTEGQKGKKVKVERMQIRKKKIIIFPKQQQKKKINKEKRENTRKRENRKRKSSIRPTPENGYNTRKCNK